MFDAPAGRSRDEPADVPVGYVRDPSLNLLRRAQPGNFAYSDGADAERRIHEAVRGARDRSTFSNELAGAIEDWPSEYHLSRQRHCIVRPLGIKPGDRVLELGCGCGAITRYLGEIDADVTAIEGAWPRARIAAERCRDLPNVTIIADDFLRYESARPFDWVLLIGVLEYAPIFSNEADPIADVLHRATGFLAPSGRLVVAIENKLGLKYFNGCAEDHVGIPFYGLQGLYGDRSPRTFGRAELAGHIRDAGLPELKFLYPFPDYKLPRVVLTDAALTDPQFDAAGTLAYLQARDYGGSPHRLFDEALVAREAARNGVLGDLSNSFLAIAARESMTCDDVLAVAFAAQREAGFATETSFMRVGDTIRVQKARLCPERAGRRRLADGSILENVPDDRAYVPGRLGLDALNLARARRGDVAAIVTALAPWFDFLKVNATPAAGTRLAAYSLPGHFLDATPFNIVEVDGGFVQIDMEWRVDRAIPLGWVVTRSIVASLCGIAGFERDAVNITDVIEALCARHGLVVSADEISAWLARENELQSLSSGRPIAEFSSRMLSQQLVPLPECAAELTARAETAAALEAQIALIFRSHSWRYSYPIRAVGRLLRKQSLERLPLAASTAEAIGLGLDKAEAAISQISHLLLGGPRGALWDDVRRYGWGLAAVVATYAITHLLLVSGFPVPRMLLYIAAVAVTARVGGLGPGAFAMAASVLAICLSAPSKLLFMHTTVFAERLGVFLVCAIVGILVSASPEQAARATRAHAPPAQPHRRAGG
jgi:SAM-dependent methyltransferase